MPNLPLAAMPERFLPSFPSQKKKGSRKTRGTLIPQYSRCSSHLDEEKQSDPSEYHVTHRFERGLTRIENILYLDKGYGSQSNFDRASPSRAGHGVSACTLIAASPISPRHNISRATENPCRLPTKPFIARASDTLHNECPFLMYPESPNCILDI